MRWRMPPTWSGIMEPLEALEAELAALWGPFGI